MGKILTWHGTSTWDERQGGFSVRKQEDKMEVKEGIQDHAYEMGCIVCDTTHV